MRKLQTLFRLAALSLILQQTPTQALNMTDTPKDPIAEVEAPRFLTTQSPSNHPDPSYLLSLDKWRTQHTAALTQPDSWLSLVALEWLKPGDTTIGSDSKNIVRLDHAPPQLAILRLDGPSLYLVPPAGGFPAGTTLDHKPATAAKLTFDSELRFGPLLFIVIQRGDRLYVRARDAASPTLQRFRTLHWYAPDPKFKITARWIPSAMSGNLAVTNVLGQTTDESSPGRAEFTLYGQTVRLFPIVEDKQSLFFIFRDATSKTNTYGAGRFLYTDLPSNGIGRPGTIVLDFNKAENPPCAYTPYATCPLPPQQNRLTIPIPAGEQRFHD
jgi:uncharacterized protein (DUF1684 family)